jgi:hypothetical protein
VGGGGAEGNGNKGKTLKILNVLKLDAYIILKDLA